MDLDGYETSTDLWERITLELIVDVHISHQEERLMKIDEQVTQELRDEYSEYPVVLPKFSSVWFSPFFFEPWTEPKVQFR
jgi:hypothetical protein